MVITKSRLLLAQVHHQLNKCSQCSLHSLSWDGMPWPLTLSVPLSSAEGSFQPGSLTTTQGLWLQHCPFALGHLDTPNHLGPHSDLSYLGNFWSPVVVGSEVFEDEDISGSVLLSQDNLVRVSLIFPAQMAVSSPPPLQSLPQQPRLHPAGHHAQQAAWISPCLLTRLMTLIPCADGASPKLPFTRGLCFSASQPNPVPSLLVLHQEGRKFSGEHQLHQALCQPSWPCNKKGLEGPSVGSGVTSKGLAPDVMCRPVSLSP
jgi:hypothetical protein